MRTRAFVAFWGATIGATLFLGASWNAAARALSDGGGPIDAAVTAIAALGLVACLIVSGRIALVTGRALRRSAPT